VTLVVQRDLENAVTHVIQGRWPDLKAGKVITAVCIQSGKCCALGEFLIKLWLEIHQVHSTFRFEFARSTQSAVQQYP